MVDTDSGIVSTERALLGAILVSPTVLRVLDLQVSDFFSAANAVIYRAILDLEADEAPIDLVTVKNRLAASQSLGLAGGVAGLAGLTDGVPSTESAGHWAKIVREASRRRRLDARLRAALDAADASDAIKQSEAAVSEWQADAGNLEATRPISEMVKDAFETLERLADTSKDGIAGLSTGFKALDAILCGLKPGELILLAARPAMGKTSLAMQMVRRSSARSLVISLEMSGGAIVRRLMATEAEVNQRAIPSGLRTSQWNSLAKSAVDLRSAPIWINERAHALRAIRRAARGVTGLELIVVDYLQLMESEKAERHSNRQEQVAAFSRGLKRLAQDLGVPIIALSQLSRPADRKDKRPQLTDLRESGALEQDADAVILIYREEVHNPTDANRGRAEIIVAKQREGDTGTVKVNWDKTTTRFFEDPEPEPEQESLL